MEERETTEKVVVETAEIFEKIEDQHPVKEM